MKKSLAITALWSLLLAAASLTIAGAFPFYPARPYDFTMPFVAHAAAAHIAAVLGLVLKGAQPTAFWSANALHGSLVLSYRSAMSQWPGGDDGPGMAWLFIVGGGSYLALGMAVFSVVLVAASMFRQRER